MMGYLMRTGAHNKPGTPETEYQTGDRSGRITVTAVGAFQGSPYDEQELVDGAAGIGFFFSTANANTFSMKFDFGALWYVDEATLTQSGSYEHGDWQWSGSTNDSDWDTIGGTFTLGAGGTTDIHTTLNGNTTPYRYYKLYGVSGTTANQPYLREMDFKEVAA